MFFGKFVSTDDYEYALGLSNHYEQVAEAWKEKHFNLLSKCQEEQAEANRLRFHERLTDKLTYLISENFVVSFQQGEVTISRNGMSVVSPIENDTESVANIASALSDAMEEFGNVKQRELEKMIARSRE